MDSHHHHGEREMSNYTAGQRKFMALMTPAARADYMAKVGPANMAAASGTRPTVGQRRVAALAAR